MFISVAKLECLKWACRCKYHDRWVQRIGGAGG